MSEEGKREQRTERKPSIEEAFDAGYYEEILDECEGLSAEILQRVSAEDVLKVPTEAYSSSFVTRTTVSTSSAMHILFSGFGIDTVE